MQGGDLEAWISTSVLVVLEDTLATVTEEPKSWGIRKRPAVIADPDQWTWHEMPLRSVVDLVSRIGVKVEVVTFLGEDVADKAAEWFDRYGVPVTSTESVNFDMFCRSLIRRPEVDRVVDTSLGRLTRYGQKGYSVMVGEAFQ